MCKTTSKTHSTDQPVSISQDIQQLKPYRITLHNDNSKNNVLNQYDFAWLLIYYYEYKKKYQKNYIINISCSELSNYFYCSNQNNQQKKVIVY